MTVARLAGDLDLEHALYVISRWTIVNGRAATWTEAMEDRRNRMLLNNVLAALGLPDRIEADLDPRDYRRRVAK